MPSSMRRLCAGLVFFVGSASLHAADVDWPAYGGDASKQRHSSLAQINRGNVGQLALAWSHDTHEKGDTQTQPIVVGRVMYTYTPTHKAIALDAAAGKLLWTFDPGIAGTGANRGLMAWHAGKDARVFAAVDNFVYALDATTGKPIASFGQQGRIDLRENLGRDPASQSVRLTTPGVIWHDLMIVGGRVSEALPASPGFVRAYDVRSGALRWTFHTIPQPGEPGYETWPKDAWQYIGGANSWSGMTLDAKRGLVYVPTGSAASDFYGGNREGANLYANCLLAIEASTGKLRWHFQFVKHDVLDRDLPSAPTLVTLKRDGKPLDALVQTTKQGFVFVLERDTGRPVFPIAEVPAPPTDVPGEVTINSYLRPSTPAPYARQRLTAEDLTTRTPEANRWARAEFAKMRSDGPFKPLTVGIDTTIYPGFDGGAEWGGPAFDPDTGLLYINANEMSWVGSLAPNDVGRSTAKSIYLRECAACHGDAGRGSPPQFPSVVEWHARMNMDQFRERVRKGGGRMPAFPTLQDEAIQAIAAFLDHGEDRPVGTPDTSAANQPYRFTGYRRWLDPAGYPAIGMPWGTLNAIDLRSGEYAWRIPFGEFPELAARGMKDTGSENYGGPLVTSGGLLFIGASIHDRKFRAFDKLDGKLLWEAALPFSADATPITYQVDGRQYVAIFASGGKERGGSGGGVLLSYALPARPASTH
ncbi:MAG TPA: PQQ-binding-like beta-propeller repeat protein [Steroidobacteraceae bacterium]|nr:PQQ-binding-like beta-propeller repeat protein [Steroidobacteraceae bacterium]